jgi:hypothetical protein
VNDLSKRVRVSGKKTTPAQALGVKQIGREVMFAPGKGGKLEQIGIDLKKKKEKSLPASQRITWNDVRMMGAAPMMAAGAIITGYQVGKKIHRALKKRTLKANVQDLKDEAKNNIKKSLNLHHKLFEEKRSPFMMGRTIAGKKKTYPYGPNPYYHPKED